MTIDKIAETCIDTNICVHFVDDVQFCGYGKLNCPYQLEELLALQDGPRTATYHKCSKPTIKDPNKMISYTR